MSTPGAAKSPGWYPSPDGTGQQWWNGASWSDARRNADGSNPVLGGLPGYNAAPPPGGLGQSIPPPAPSAGIKSGPAGTVGSWIVPLVFAVVGFLFFNLFAVFAFFFGLVSMRGATPFGKVMSAIAVLIAGAAIVSGIISFVQGDRSIEDLIF